MAVTDFGELAKAAWKKAAFPMCNTRTLGGVHPLPTTRPMKGENDPPYSWSAGPRQTQPGKVKGKIIIIINQAEDRGRKRTHRSA